MKTSRTVLLVEDDADDQEFFLDALEGIENASVYNIVKNGRDALMALEKSTVYPDIIFMDISMPHMNGIDCLAQIIQNPLTCKIPVVILSTHSNQMEVARNIGARIFLIKPNNRTDLRRQIQAAINVDFINSPTNMQTYPTMIHAS